MSLYSVFEHWFSPKDKKGQIWLYSDPHFSDDEMKCLRTNYIGDEEQVKRINSKVGKYDTIIFLGDVGDIEFIKKIKGYKVLIMGNHDKGASNYKRKIEYILDEEHGSLEYDLMNKLIKIDNHLFDEVYEGALIIGPKILLSHEPVDWKFGINIHGHDHSNSEGYGDELHINVCAEHINYTPVSLSEIIKSGKLGKAVDIHRQTIDKAIKRKTKKITKSEN